jgi:hypothetical protein
VRRHPRVWFAAAALATLSAFTGSAAAAAPDLCPNSAIRGQQHATYLPDCRAFERVSPADKNGYPIFDLRSITIGLVASSPDGNSAIYPSWGTFADSESGLPTQYRSQRSDQGWTATAVSPAPKGPHPWSGDELFWVASTPDLRNGLIFTADPQDPTAIGGAQNLYTTDGHGVSLASRGNGGERPVVGEVRWDRRGLFSVDGSHLFWEGSHHLVAEDASRPEGKRGIYERSAGVTRLVNVDSNEQALNECAAEIGDARNAARSRAISSDGSRVVFVSPASADFGAPGCEEPELYMRIDDDRTVEISRSRLAVEDPFVSDPSFFGAARDGSVLYFASEEQLTADAPSGGGVYRYVVTTDSLEFAFPGPNARVVALANDGSRLYFTAVEQLEAGKGTPDNVKLFVYRAVDDSIRFIADSGGGGGFGGVPGADQGISGAEEERRPAALSADGTRLVFTSRTNLTGYDSSGEGEVYLYEEGRDSLICVSCSVTGAPRTTDSFLRGYPNGDASVVAFATKERMSPADTDQAEDVYRWKDGDISLVSGGRSALKSRLVGIDESGASIFFSSYDSLAPQDVDGGDQDLYVSRAGGGFLAPDAGSAPCQGDSCQNRVGGVLPGHAPGSSEYQGGGNLRAKSCAKQRRQLGKAKQAKRRAAAGKRKAGAQRHARKARGELRNCRRGRA